MSSGQASNLEYERGKKKIVKKRTDEDTVPLGGPGQPAGSCVAQETKVSRKEGGVTRLWWGRTDGTDAKKQGEKKITTGRYPQTAAASTVKGMLWVNWYAITVRGGKSEKKGLKKAPPLGTKGTPPHPGHEYNKGNRNGPKREGSKELTERIKETSKTIPRLCHRILTKETERREKNGGKVTTKGTNNVAGEKKFRDEP